MPGVSDNIRVRSIVGRFLEHSRVYWFENGGEPELYLSSADWMERNFFRRVEIAFPVLRQQLRERILQRPGDLPGRQRQRLGAAGRRHVCARQPGRRTASRCAGAAARTLRRRAGAASLAGAVAREHAQADAVRVAGTRSRAAGRRPSADARRASAPESAAPASRPRGVELDVGSAAALRPRCSSTASRSSTIR